MYIPLCTRFKKVGRNDIFSLHFDMYPFSFLVILSFGLYIVIHPGSLERRYQPISKLDTLL